MLYRFVMSGPVEELRLLSPPEVVEHLRNYLGNYYLDPPVASTYINRLGAVSQEENTPAVQEWLLYLLKKYNQMKPLDEDILKILAKPGSLEEQCLRAVRKCGLPEPAAAKINALQAEDGERAYGLLQKFFSDYPYSPFLLERLLLTELKLNIPAGRGWADRVRLPYVLRPHFDFMLMQTRLMGGDVGGALEIYEQNPDLFNDEYRLIHAAEALAAAGDREKSISLYKRALKLDPFHMAAVYRIRQLEHPLMEEREALNSKIAVCLYSYNKSRLLQAGLRCLAASETAGAAILVLLNGCTDDSLEAVCALNKELFNGRIEIINLPVNVGAPAARNWLLASKTCREADYVAFWDDDVLVRADWLPKMLTVLKSNPGAGVVGAKILSPGRPKQLQYLYRNISIAQEGFLRLSRPVPTFNLDGGFYDFVRPTVTVMGCCHIFTRAACDAVPTFDLGFSPSQMDDICHDIDLRLAGFKVMYCGLVECEHFRMSGTRCQHGENWAERGQAQGNDVKFYYRFADKLRELGALNNLAEAPEPL